MLSSEARSWGVLAAGARQNGLLRVCRASIASAAAGAPGPDLNALWEEHIATEFEEKCAKAAVATMVPHASVNHVPVMTGGSGTAALESFYHNHFIHNMPPDVQLTPIDRVVARDTVVDEFIFDFTHSVEMDWMLPGIAPTGKRVRVPFIVVVKFEGSKLLAERIYWDQASVLAQLGLIDTAGLPVAGAEQAAKATQMANGGGDIPSNGLVAKLTESSK
jgi:carboxymethylenebutenolidase